MHILYNGATHKWKYLPHNDIGNVNDITVTYYPYNGFATLRNKNMRSIFQYVTQQPFNIFEEL